MNPTAALDKPGGGRYHNFSGAAPAGLGGFPRYSPRRAGAVWGSGIRAGEGCCCMMMDALHCETQRLYYKDVEMIHFTARVLSCEQAEQGWLVTLSSTAFYPEGGGQPADQGILGGVRVLDVHEKDGRILHLTDGPLAVGEEVSGDIDPVRRVEMMQQHTGEHILSGILHQLFGAENVGFHIGEDSVTIDTSIPITAEQLAEAEYQANVIIWADMAVRVSWHEPKTLAGMEYRSKKELDGPVRIVEIEGADRCACCGIHMERAGQVGLIKVLSLQNYKRGSRIAIACGRRALTDYRIKCAEHNEISVLLSAKANQIAPAVHRLAEENEGLKARLAAAENKLFARLAADTQPGAAPLLVCEGLAPDGVRRLCAALCEKTGAPCAALSPSAEGGYLYALGQAGPSADVRPLGRAFNEAFNGRGGGKPGLVQGSIAAAGIGAVEAFWKEHTAP